MATGSWSTPRLQLVAQIYLVSLDLLLFYIHYLTQAVSSPMSNPGKQVLFGYVPLSVCPGLFREFIPVLYDPMAGVYENLMLFKVENVYNSLAFSLRNKLSAEDRSFYSI